PRAGLPIPLMQWPNWHSCRGGEKRNIDVHQMFEQTVWPESLGQWLAVLGLGLLPAGAAFYTWDYGVKHGDIMVLGASSYTSPLLSSIVLVVTGFAEPHWTVAVACLLITAGAAVAAKDMLH